jgi:hypothetical protein
MRNWHFTLLYKNLATNIPLYVYGSRPELMVVGGRIY